jgi:predicted aspartyl protease
MHSRLETFKRKLCSSLRYIVAKEVLLAPAITVLFSLMSSCSSYAKTDALGVVDFRLLQRALIVVPIFIDDKGPFNFVLDTGTETSLIDAALARRLGLVRQDSIPLQTPNGQQNANLFIVSRLSVGGLATTHVEVLEADLHAFSGSGSQILGLLGEDFLSQFNLLLDYRHRSVAFYERRDSQSPIAGSHISISIVHACPFVNAEFSDGRTLRLFLDSGTTSLVLHNIHIPEFHSCGPPACYGTLRTAVGTSTVIQGHISGLRVGDVRFQNIAASISRQTLPDDPADGDPSVITIQ